MATKFSIVRDINGYNGFGLLPSDYNVSVTLDTSTDTSVTVPSKTPMGGCNSQSQPVWLAIFNYTVGADVWVAINDTAEVPAGNTFAVTTSMLNPSALLVYGASADISADVIHCISSGTDVNVSIRFYSLS